MVGCLSKIISKILARRLTGVMPLLVGETQSAFVQKRQILDSVLVANKVIWWMKKKKWKGVLLKLDFHKAYDNVRWDFLDNVLRLIGFGLIWRKWIECCITTALMSILINESPPVPLKLERGLRQGDPLSPFLFVMVAEVLNCLLKRAKDYGIIEGVKVGRNDVDISQ